MAIGKISMRVLGAWLAVHRGWEDGGNCQGQRILNFNLRRLISSELVIYLGALSTKSSLTTGHKYLHKHNTAACFPIPFLLFLLLSPISSIHPLNTVRAQRSYRYGFKGNIILAVISCSVAWQPIHVYVCAGTCTWKHAEEDMAKVSRYLCATSLGLLFVCSLNSLTSEAALARDSAVRHSRSVNGLVPRSSEKGGLISPPQ